MRKPFLLLAALAAARLFATPAEDREWATRVKCELNTATDVSLPDLTWQQGTTPRLSLDQYRQGKAVAADSNVTAIVRFGPSATSTYFVPVTNYAVSGNGYLVDIPTVGTNTTGVAAGWWYTAYFEKSGKRFWTGNGRVDIVETTSTEDGLTWQALTTSGEVQAEALLRIAGDAANSNNVAAVRTELLATNTAVADRITGIATNYLPAAALAATALQPSWAVTGTVANAQRLVSADGSLVWMEIENGTNWLVCVTHTTDVYVSAVSGEGYNGPPLGTVWTNPQAGIVYPDQIVWDTAEGFFFEGPYWPNIADVVSPTVQNADGSILWESSGEDWEGTSFRPVSDAIGSLSCQWVPVTNRTQIATQTGTVILLTEHDADAGAHPTLPRHSDVTNTVSAAVAAIPRVPTNAVTGWLMYDYGSNMWLRVSVSNWSFTVWEVVE